MPLADTTVVRALRDASRRSRAVAVLTAAAAAVSLSAGAGPAAATVTCDKVAAIGGSDGAAGTVDAPFASASKLVASLASGQTGCLRDGTYTGELVGQDPRRHPQQLPGRACDRGRPGADRGDRR